MSVKKLIVAILATLFVTQFLYSFDAIIELCKNSSEGEIVSQLYHDEISSDTKDLCYKSYIRSLDYIPEKFREPFIDATIHTKKLGIELLGIAYHESRWKYFYNGKNKNGSSDHGPLMLNSYNIRNERFMRVFSKDCDDYIHDPDIYYMLVCINYYKSLRTSYGPYSALMVYNGGLRVLKNNAPRHLKKITKQYANLVYSHINRYDSEWNSFRTRNKELYESVITYDYITRYRLEQKSSDNPISYRYSLWYLESLRRQIYNHMILNDSKLDAHYDRKFVKLYILKKWPTIRYMVPISSGLDSNRMIVLKIA